MFQVVDDFMREHYRAIIIALVVVLIAVIIIFSMGISLAKKSEYLPWKNTSEHLFSGDLSPSEQAMYNRLSAADPVNTKTALLNQSAMGKEYMNNKVEVPVLVDKLYA